MRLRVALLCVLVPLAMWALLPVLAPASPQGRAATLERKIDKAREKAERKRGAERSLKSEIATYSSRIRRLQGRITTLTTRQQRLQADLDLKEAELSRTQAELRQERARLVRLRKRLKEARTMLSTRLVEIYKAGDVDLVSVVLDSKGFAELLERTEFLERISDNDLEIVEAVRVARRDAVETEKRLDRLERRQERLVREVEARRDEVAATKEELVGTRTGYRRTKEGKEDALVKVRSDRHEIEEDLEAMEKEQAAIQAKLAAASSGGSQKAGPIRRGSGSLIWPVNAGVSSPFGQRWGRLHAGIDIAAPTGTPIRAADSGKVVLLGWTGGYGNYTCIQHSGSLSTCYAHQSRYGTSMGASVKQGQVIGYVGNTGNSTGAHLHFETRVNGVPQNPMGYL